MDSGVSSSGGDMLTSVYDANGDGVVDNASSLGGISASSFATQTYVQLYVSRQITGALEGSY